MFEQAVVAHMVNDPCGERERERVIVANFSIHTTCIYKNIYIFYSLIIETK